MINFINEHSDCVPPEDFLFEEVCEGEKYILSFIENGETLGGWSDHDEFGWHEPSHEILDKKTKQILERHASSPEEIEKQRFFDEELEHICTLWGKFAAEKINESTQEKFGHFSFVYEGNGKFSLRGGVHMIVMKTSLKTTSHEFEADLNQVLDSVKTHMDKYKIA